MVYNRQRAATGRQQQVPHGPLRDGREVLRQRDSVHRRH